MDPTFGTAKLGRRKSVVRCNFDRPRADKKVGIDLEPDLGGKAEEAHGVVCGRC